MRDLRSENRSRAARALERTLFVVGLLLLGHWAQVKTASWRFQSREIARLDDGALAAVRAPQPGDVLGRIEIPEVGIDSVIVEGTEERHLELAVGHIPGTALPGQPGLVGLAGHRDTDFRGLRRIREGQRIRVTTPEGPQEYRVTSTRVVAPDDVEVLDRPDGGDALALVTCFPFGYVGPAPRRFVVHAEP